MKKFKFESMGTTWEITIWDKISQALFDELEDEIIVSTDRFDLTYSRFKKDSLVSKIAATKGSFFVPLDFTKMLQWYFDLYLLSDKTLNPFIGKVLSDAGYDENYSFQQKKSLSKIEDLQKCVKIVDSTTIRTTKPLLFDFGALGKGYFVDKIASYLTKKGINRFLVNGSGDIYYMGDQPIRVGLEHPGDISKVIGVVEMTTGTMCASAGNRRKWGEYHHIIDPRNLKPAQDIIATWVMSDRCVLSDALATCLFFVDSSNFSNKYEFEYLILNKEMKVKKSDGFKVELF